MKFILLPSSRLRLSKLSRVKNGVGSGYVSDRPPQRTSTLCSHEPKVRLSMISLKNKIGNHIERGLCSLDMTSSCSSNLTVHGVTIPRGENKLHPQRSRGRTSPASWCFKKKNLVEKMSFLVKFLRIFLLVKIPKSIIYPSSYWVIAFPRLSEGCFWRAPPKLLFFSWRWSVRCTQSWMFTRTIRGNCIRICKFVRCLPSSSWGLWSVLDKDANCVIQAGIKMTAPFI